LSNEAKANAFITIPGMRGLPPKEISVKNLANIIQARMSEILDFVTYHLKQVGMDSRMLNGGIVLTGGGSQLKHLIQLTEYVTGLNARIGYPNEHLASNHTDELTKPMYATCIGLILKGYDDYERNRKLFTKQFKMVEIPKELKKEIQEAPVQDSVAADAKDEPIEVTARTRKLAGINGFWSKFKDNLIDLFKEEEDKNF
jgi:cell division protein FtsA